MKILEFLAGNIFYYLVCIFIILAAWPYNLIYFIPQLILVVLGIMKTVGWKYVFIPTYFVLLVAAFYLVIYWNFEGM
jgi:hypothetical protein